MQKTTASIRYAKALFQLTLDENKSADVLADLKKISKLIDSEEQLINLLTNPTIKQNTKEKLFKKIFTERVNNITMNFLFLILRKGREAHLVDIIHKYEEIYNQHNNISVVHIVSAQPLSDAQKEKIKEKTNLSGGEVKLKEKINKNLLGGFIIKRGDLQYDASIKKKLSNAKRAFKL